MRKIVAIFSILLLGVAVGHAQLIELAKDKSFDYRKWHQGIIDISKERSRILGHRQPAMWLYAEGEYIDPQRYIEQAKRRENISLPREVDSVLKLHAKPKPVRPQMHFATTADAERFLRGNYSFYASAYPDRHAEIVRRLVALLETRLTLTPTERKFLEYNSKEIASVAATLDPTPRLAEFKRLLGSAFSQLRLQSVISILRIDGESLYRAEQRYIFDLYEGHFKEPQWCKKAVAIWFIYGVKVPLPRYSTSVLVSAPKEVCEY